MVATPVVATRFAAGLDRLLQTGNADFIVAEMGICSLVGFSTWAATLAVLLSTFRWINDRHRQVQGSCEGTLRGTRCWMSLFWCMHIPDTTVLNGAVPKQGRRCSAHHPYEHLCGFEEPCWKRFHHAVCSTSGSTMLP